MVDFVVVKNYCVIYTIRICSLDNCLLYFWKISKNLDKLINRNTMIIVDIENIIAES